ncbi:UNVERIFIED_CONTAM: hypothetical protein K2H54_037830 [Gekko kuhli]
MWQGTCEVRGEALPPPATPPPSPRREQTLFLKPRETSMAFLHRTVGRGEASGTRVWVSHWPLQESAPHPQRSQEIAPQHPLPSAPGDQGPHSEEEGEGEMQRWQGQIPATMQPKHNSRCDWKLAGPLFQHPPSPAQRRGSGETDPPPASRWAPLNSTPHRRVAHKPHTDQRGLAPAPTSTGETTRKRPHLSPLAASRTPVLCLSLPAGRRKGGLVSTETVSPPAELPVSRDRAGRGSF